MALPKVKKTQKKKEQKQFFTFTDPFALNVFAGNHSGANIPVNHETVLGVPAVYSCTSLIGSTCAKLPCEIYTIGSDGSHEIAKEHPAYELLNNRANEYQSAIDCRLKCIADAALHGNGYLAIERDSYGEPVSLHNLDPSTTILLYRWIPGSLQPTDIVVRSTVWSGGVIDIPYANCIHLRGLGGRNQGLMGEPVLSLCREYFALSIATINYGSHFYGNYGNVGLVVEVPTAANEAQQKQLKAILDNLHTGTKNSGRSLILTNGTKLVPITGDNRANQWIESMDQVTRGVCQLFGIPSALLGVKDSVSYNSLEQQNIAFLQSLDPWLLKFENEVFTKMLSEADKKSGKYHVSHDRDKLIRNDTIAESDQLIKDVQAGLRTRNEARAIKKLPSFGPDGDRRMISTTFSFDDMPAFDPDAAQEAAEKAATPPMTTPQVDTEQAPQVEAKEDKAKAMKASIIDRFCKRMKKNLESKKDKFSAYVQNELYNDHLAVLVETVKPLTDDAVAVSTAIMDGFKQELEATTKEQLGAVIERLRDTLNRIENE